MINAKEIEKFTKDAPHWWDESGPFAPLHKLNPVRMRYIKQQICDHYGLDDMALTSLKGLSVIDIGCGGGLVCEPLARMGANVTGLDADPAAINVAKAHAKDAGLKITYKNTALAKHKKTYDVVLALEIIEHVDDQAAFVNECLSLAKPGGLIIFSTLNRTAKSYALGIVAAEYILNWVPKGTHEWKKFVKPSELSRYIRTASARDFKPHEVKGLVYNPLSERFSMHNHDIDVNYFITAKADT